MAEILLLPFGSAGDVFPFIWLGRQLKARGHRAAFTTEGAEALAETLATSIQPGDMVVCLGAGDITKWAAGLADAIRARRAP